MKLYFNLVTLMSCAVSIAAVISGRFDVATYVVSLACLMRLERAQS